MSDAALEAAKARMSELEREISSQRNSIKDAHARLARLENEHANVAAWVDMWHQLAGTQQNPVAAERNMIGLPVENAVKRNRPKNPDRDVVANVALEIIREYGQPLSRHELFKKLTERGIVIDGKDPEMVLSTMLWRSKDKIVRLPPFGYWPKELAFEEAKYWPEIDELIGAAANEPEDGNEIENEVDIQGGD